MRTCFQQHCLKTVEDLLRLFSLVIAHEIASLVGSWFSNSGIVIDKMAAVDS